MLVIPRKNLIVSNHLGSLYCANNVTLKIRLPLIVVSDILSISYGKILVFYFLYKINAWVYTSICNSEEMCLYWADGYIPNHTCKRHAFLARSALYHQAMSRIYLQELSFPQLMFVVFDRWDFTCYAPVANGGLCEFNHHI